MIYIGYIKLWRGIKGWEWARDPLMVALWVYLLITANWTQGCWQGITVDRGQIVTSLQRLSVETGLSINEVRGRLVKLEKSGEITRVTNNRYQIITIVNYDTYQGEHSPEHTQINTSEHTKDYTQNSNEVPHDNEKNETSENNDHPQIHTPEHTQNSLPMHNDIRIEEDNKKRNSLTGDFASSALYGGSEANDDTAVKPDFETVEKSIIAYGGTYYQDESSAYAHILPTDWAVSTADNG